MDKITVVGLGNGDYRQLTLEAAELFTPGSTLILEGASDNLVPWLKRRQVTYSVWAKAWISGASSGEIMDRLAAEASSGPVLYGVMGSGLEDSRVVSTLLSQGLIDRIVPGISAYDHAGNKRYLIK